MSNLLKRLALWFLRRYFEKSEPDLQEFFKSIVSVKPGVNGYTKKDRYVDFTKVFSTPEGKRVLGQIIEHSEGFPIMESEVGDTNRMIYRAGRREPGLWIVKILNTQPYGDI